MSYSDTALIGGVAINMQLRFHEPKATSQRLLKHPNADTKVHVIVYKSATVPVILNYLLLLDQHTAYP